MPAGPDAASGQGPEPAGRATERVRVPAAAARRRASAVVTRRTTTPEDAAVAPPSPEPVPPHGSRAPSTPGGRSRAGWLPGGRPPVVSTSARCTRTEAAVARGEPA